MKRRGQSKEFLKKLRKKYKIGEYAKKRQKRQRKSPGRALDDLQKRRKSVKKRRVFQADQFVMGL